MKVSVQLDNGATMEFQHTDLPKLAQALYKAAAVNVAYEGVLRECRHELTTHHGLIAHDGDPALAWSLDTLQVLGKIDAVLPPLAE